MDTNKITEMLEEYADLLDTLDGKEEQLENVEDVLYQLQDELNQLFTLKEVLEFYKSDADDASNYAKELVIDFEDYPDEVKEIWLNGVDYACTYFRGRDEF